MRNRNILKMILLTIVTFGIYYLYWLVSTTREMRTKGADIPNAILIIIPIINIWWMWKYSKGVEHVTNEKLSAILTFILMYAVGFIGIYIVQDSFNDVSAPGIPSGNPATATTGGQAQVPGSQPIDPAGPTAATAAGAGIGVAASQVPEAQASPQQPEEPKQPETTEPKPPEQPEEPKPEEETTLEETSTEGTAPQEDDSLEQSGSETTQQPTDQDETEEDKNQDDNVPPPTDSDQTIGPSL
jgi:hypothetical protein